MRRFLQITIYFIILAVGVATGLVWNIYIQSETAELHAVIDDSHRQIKALQAQVLTQQAELATLHQRPLVALLTMNEQALAPAPYASSQSDQSPASTRESSAEQSAENEDKADTDEKEMTPATEETALARLDQFLEDIAGMRRRDRRRQRRQLVEELREMGEPALTALLQLLEEGDTLRERRWAMRLLGALRDPIALPALENVLVGDEDVRMRRNAARNLRRLQRPESIPALETALNNPQEDWYVRIQAARTLTKLGEARGVDGLLDIYAESVDDGRARYGAFRALNSLNNAAALPLMRQIVASESDVSYRRRAVRFLGRNGNQEDYSLLQQVMESQNEQPSIVEAAQNAYADLSTR